MIEKSIFVKSMEEIEKIFQKEDKFNNALDEYDDGNYHCFVPSHILVERAVVPFIAQSLGLDPENNNDIELVMWFIWDCDFGREESNSEISLTDKEEKEKKKFVLKNSGDFYDFVKTLLEERQKDGNNKESNNKQI